MRRHTSTVHTSTVIAAGLAAVLGILSVPHPASAQAPNLFQPDIPVPPYTPYPTVLGTTPPSILPPDLQPEIYRVRREVQTIFDRYFAEWQALTPPVLSNTQGVTRRYFRAPDMTLCEYLAGC